MKNLFLLAALSLGFAASAEANSFNVNRCTGWFYAGQSCTQNLDAGTFVDRIYVSAEGSSQHGTVQVYADGEWVARLGVPGRDPVYPVIIRKQVSNVRFDFENTVRIVAVSVETSEKPNHHHFNGAAYDIKSPKGMAEAILDIVNCLQQTASDSEFRTYLKPLRKAAIRMAASGGGRPMLSRKTESKGSDLVSAINAAEGYFDRLSDNAEYTDVVEKILEIREWITSNYEM